MAIDFNKIKGLFVETTPNTTEQSPVKPVSPSMPQVGQPPAEKVTVDTFDQKILNSLLKVIEDHNLPGEDYLEFLSAYQAMKDIQLDDKMKVQTVLATLSTKGLTSKKIRESADYYKKVLTEEQKQFYTELGNQTNDQVKSKEKDISKLQLTNKQKSDQIAALTKEINDNQTKISEIQKSMREAEEKIKQAEISFNKTFDFVIAQINSNLNKL